MDWILDYVQEHPLIALAGLLVAALGGAAKAISSSKEIREIFSTRQLYYTATVEILALHIMYGILDTPALVASDPTARKNKGAISKWVADICSEYAKARGFCSEESEDYEAQLVGSDLIVICDKPKWKAYLYAILYWEMMGDTLESVYTGIRRNQPPMLGQLSRELHILTSDNPRLDLQRYFCGQTDARAINAGCFIDGDHPALIMTFHGSNGQFRGDTIVIEQSAVESTYRFSDGTTTKRIPLVSRKARTLMIDDPQEDLDREFLQLVRKEIAGSSTLSLPLSDLKTKQEISSIASRARTMPLGPARERFIDDNAIDLAVHVVVKEHDVRRFLWSRQAT